MNDIPDAPCMEYLPTFTPKMNKLVGKYSIHGVSGYTILQLCIMVRKYRSYFHPDES